MNTKRHYYAAYSYMGLNYTYDSPCWEVYVFDSLAERAEWLANHEYNGSNHVAEEVSLAIARKIAPELRTKDLDACREDDRPHRVTHLVNVDGDYISVR